jgi:nicotinamidase-related amidase
MTPDAGGPQALWDRYLGEDDRALVDRAGYGGRVGWGERPALLVVDMTYAFCGDDAVPPLEAIETRYNACGTPAWEAVAAAGDLLAAAREAEVPVVFTRPASRVRSVGSGRWADKNRRTRETDERAREIVEPLAPLPGEAVLDKEAPSGFFASPLVGWLTRLRVDTLVVCGGTTSGCVRATVVDAFSHNFRVLVPHEATFDRIEASQRIGLFDLDLKYADVVPVAEAVAGLRAAGQSFSSTSSSKERVEGRC